MTPRAGSAVDAKVSQTSGSYLTQAKEVVGDALEFILGFPHGLSMTETRTLTAMSLRDGRLEYVRYRPKKDKDKDRDRERDRDRDGRSSAAGSIIVRRSHRDKDSSSSKTGPPAETASQASVDTHANVACDPLPPLPESASTSPILRTTSNVSLGSRTSPSQVYTPANLQPYLESDTGESEGPGGDSQSTANLEGSREWIGPLPESPPVEAHLPESPHPESPHAPSETSDAVTPKALKESFTAPPSQKSRAASTAGGEDSRKSFRHSLYLPSEMENPFLAPLAVGETPARPATAESHRPRMVTNQRNPSPPSTALAHESSSQQMTPYIPPDVGNSSGTVSQVNTYVAAPNPVSFPYHSNFGPNFGPSFGPNFGPNFGHVDGPMALIHRVTAAIPDLHLLMQQYHDCCVAFEARGHQLRDLEAQRYEDNRRLEHLGEKLETLLKRHKAEISDLNTHIHELEDIQEDMQRRLAREASLKNEARAGIEKLRIERRQADKQHAEEKEILCRSHSQEKERLISEHNISQQAMKEHWENQIGITEANFSSRLVEVNRQYDIDKHAMEGRWSRERDEFEESATKLRQSFEDTLNTKVRTIDEERREHERIKHTWETERSDLHRRRDDDRMRHRKDLEELQNNLSKKYQREKDEAMKSFQSDHTMSHSRSQDLADELERSLKGQSQLLADTQDTVGRLEREADIDRRSVIESQETIRKLQHENSDLRASIEAVRMQRRTQSQDRRSVVFEDVDKTVMTRESSRRTSDTQENQRLRNDLANERERNEEAQDKISKLRRELEGFRTHSSGERKTASKGAADGKGVYKTNSNESTSASKSGEAPASLKGKNVTWQS